MNNFLLFVQEKLQSELYDESMFHVEQTIVYFSSMYTSNQILASYTKMLFKQRHVTKYVIVKTFVLNL